MKRIAILFCLVFQLAASPVSAQGSAITVQNDSAVLSFPDSILFSAEFTSDSVITRVRLLYGVEQDTCGEVVAIAFPEFSPSNKITASWDWDMRQSGSEPPGASIWWQWEVKDAAGNTLTTEKRSITWLDSIHSWKELQSGLIRLQYYQGNNSFGSTLRDSAINALKRLSEDTGIQPEQPIDLYIYASTDDMREAILYEPGWTGGLAYPEYNIVLIGIAPVDLEWGKRTIAHELTHVLVGDFTFSCLGAMPTWLVEGLAVYGEGGPDKIEAENFETNRTNDTLLTFQILSSGFSEDPAKADLSYSQSYYITNYLISTYGKEKLLVFLEKLKTGVELSNALESTYGFDLTSFEDEWRAENNLPTIKREISDEAATPTTIPTIRPVEGFLPDATLTSHPVTSEATLQNSPAMIPTEDDRGLFGMNTINSIYMIILGISCIAVLIFVVVFTVIISRKARKSEGNNGETL